MKKFIRFPILSTVIFIISLASGVLSHTVEPVVLIIKSSLVTIISSFVFTGLFWGRQTRYNPSQTVVYFLVASFNVFVGAFCIYWACQVDHFDWSETVFIIIIIGIVSGFSSLARDPLVSQIKMALKYWIVSFIQICLSGLITWGALEWWSVYV